VTSLAHPDRPELAPIRHGVHRSRSALRAHEAPTLRDCRELQVVGQAERGEGEWRRVLTRSIRASYEQAFEAVAFQLRDGRRLGQSRSLG